MAKKSGTKFAIFRFLIPFFSSKDFSFKKTPFAMVDVLYVSDRIRKKETLNIVKMGNAVKEEDFLQAKTIYRFFIVKSACKIHISTADN